MSGGSTAQFQEQRREIVFKGQLQQKITKRFGTLLRKKKAIYEDELWVLLCIHEGGIGGIPHLEWYGDLRSAYEHNPLKVQDLLNCQYVNVAIGEERCMVIGFVDKNRPVLELSAPSVEERRQWVAKLTETLRRLKCPLDDENAQQNDDGDEGIVGPSTCCPRPQNEYVALNEVEEFGGESSSLPHFPSSDQLPPPPSSPYVPMAAANSPAGIKLSLADPIPMHSSPPSTSASPPHFHPPQSSFSTTSPASPSTLPRIQRPKPPLTPSKPISINKMPLTPRQQQLSPNGNGGNFQRSMDENDEIEEEENEEECDDKGNDVEKEEKAKKEEENNNNLPPPLPPRKSQSHLQQSQQAMPSSCSPTPPILPSSPIPSSPPPSTTILDSSANSNATKNCEYRALEPTIRRPIPNNNNQFRAEYDQLSPSTAATAGMSFQNQYQQLSRLSGDFTEPSTGGSVLRFSNSSSGNTYSSASPNSSQRSSATGGLGQQNLPGQMQRPQQISSPRHSSGSDSQQQQQYDILAPIHHSPSPQMPLPMMNFADHIFQETLARPRRVSLSLSLLAEHVAFVDAGGKVWVAGWSPKADTNLRNILHFGDEVERMAGIELRSVKQLPEIYAQTKPGIQIELGLRANPRAKVYTLQRPTNPKRELGIVLHKRKNKIASIEPRSPADKANLPARLPPFFYNKEATELPTMITELDGVPLSLFARNEQFFHRLEPTPLNAAINLTLHPSDFCSYIASQMKAQIREYRRFVHDQ